VRNLNLPNVLTIFRLLAVPVFLVAVAREWAGAALAVFAAAAATDVVDGLLARLLRQETELGGWMDPLADKLLVFSSFIALTVVERASFPAWFTAVVLGRDAFTVLGIGLLTLVGRKVVIDPSRLSKYATFFQMVVLILALGHRWAGEATLVAAQRAAMATCLVLTLVSVGQYTWRGSRILLGRA
jgi:cardiolipin synthase